MGLCARGSVLRRENNNRGYAMEEERTARSGEQVIRHTYYIRPDQVKALRVKAAENGRDTSWLLREAIDRFLRIARPKDKPKPTRKRTLKQSVKSDGR